MANAKNQRVLPLKLIQRNVGRLTEVDDEFSVIEWRIMNGTAHRRMSDKQAEALLYRLDRADGGLSIFRFKKIVKTG